MSPPFASKQDLFCEAAVVNGFVSRAQIEECRPLLRADPTIDIGSLLLGRGYIDASQRAKLDHAVDVSWSRMQTGGASPNAAPTSVDPLAGKTLAGEFRLTRLLGRGGMGAVYLAEQVSLRRPVAVKLLPLAATSEASAVERFQREAVAAARLTHSNIVQVHFFGQQDGQYFIAMEYVEGESLHDVQKRQGKMPPKEVARVARDVARALSAAHAQGFVHRDVKPENVFVGKGGLVKLGDFGLARDTAGDGHLSITGQVMGTPYYMPPEQVKGLKVDSRADLYALGATMFHLLAGKPPYEGNSVLEILNQQLSSPVPTPQAFGPDVPRALVDLVRRMMAKEPDRRPASADEVIAALDAFLAAPSAPATRGPGRPPSKPAIRAVKPPSRPAVRAAKEPPPMPRFERGVRTYAILAAAAIVAMGVGVLVFSRHDRQPGSLTPSPGSNPSAVATSTGPPSMPPVPVPATTHTDTTPPASHDETPRELREARIALDKGDPGQAIQDLDAAPESVRNGDNAKAWKSLRDEALAKLMADVGPRLAGVRDLIALHDFATAEKRLAEIATTDVAEIAEKVAQVRQELLQQRDALAKAAAQAKAARDEAEKAWGTFAAGVWALMEQGSFAKALEECKKATEDEAFHLVRDRLGAFEELMGAGDDVDAELNTAFRGLEGKPITLRRKEAGEVKGTLVKVSDVECQVKLNEPGHPSVAIKLSDIDWRDFFLRVRASVGKGADGEKGVAVWLMAGGDFDIADPILEKAAAEGEKDPFTATAVGWEAPWSASAREARAKAKPANPPGGAANDDAMRAAMEEGKRLAAARSYKEAKAAYEKALAVKPGDKTVEAALKGLDDLRAVDPTQFDVRWKITCERVRAGDMWVVDVSFSPDGKFLAAALWDGSVRVIETASGRETARQVFPKGGVYSVAWHPDGKFVLFSYFEPSSKGEMVWDCNPKHPPVKFRCDLSEPGGSIVFQPNGKVVFLRKSGGAELVGLDWASGATVFTHRGGAFVFTPDGRTFIYFDSNGNAIKAHDVAGDREIATLTGHRAEVYTLALSPDGKTLASASDDQTVGLWDWRAGKALCERSKFPGAALKVVFASDGRTLVAAGRGGDLLPLDPTDGRTCGALHAGQGTAVTSLRLSADGRMLASGGDDGSIILWASER